MLLLYIRSLSFSLLLPLFQVWLIRFSLFFSFFLFGHSTPATADTAIYTGPTDSEAVRRNKSRLLYKCCQQNRNIAFAYQLFAVQFTRASGGRQNGLGTTTKSMRRNSREIVKGGWERLTTQRVARCSCTLQINSPPRQGDGIFTTTFCNFLPDCLLPACPLACSPTPVTPLPHPQHGLLLARFDVHTQSKYFHPNILKMSKPIYSSTEPGIPVPGFRLLGTSLDTNCSVFRWGVGFVPRALLVVPWKDNS